MNRALTRAGRRSQGTIVLSREQTKLSRTMSLLGKKRTNTQNPFLKILERSIKERTIGSNGNWLKRRVWNQERFLKHLEIIEIGENCRVLIYLLNCKFCQFGRVWSMAVLYLPPFTQPYPPLSPSSLNPFQPVP